VDILRVGLRLQDSTESMHRLQHPTSRTNDHAMSSEDSASERLLRSQACCIELHHDRRGASSQTPASTQEHTSDQLKPTTVKLAVLRK